MKIRATLFYSEDALTADALKRQLTPRLEGEIDYPLKISNNECQALLGDETKDKDSPLSFLIKYKASFSKPNDPPKAIMGFEISDAGFSNQPINDNKSPFHSVNANHFDLTIQNENDLDQLIVRIQSNSTSHKRFNIATIGSYIKRTIDDPEWQVIYAKSDSWKKFSKKVLIAYFKKTHCPLERDDLEAYSQRGSSDFEEDLKFLASHNAVTDTEKLKLLRELFPDIFR